MIKILSFAMVSVAAATTREYSAVKVGEFVPPNPPATEMLHLKRFNLGVGEKLPIPPIELASEETAFMEVSASASEAALEPQRVPHNWYVYVVVVVVCVVCLFFVLFFFWRLFVLLLPLSPPPTQKKNFIYYNLKKIWSLTSSSSLFLFLLFLFSFSFSFSSPCNEQVWIRQIHGTQICHCDWKGGM